MQTDFSRFSYSPRIVWFRDRMNKNQNSEHAQNRDTFPLNVIWGAFHLLMEHTFSGRSSGKFPGIISSPVFPLEKFRWKSMFLLRVFTRNHRQFQAIQARRYLWYHLEFWWRTHKRMELVSNGTHSSLDGPFHGSFRKFLVNGKRLWTLVNGDNRHLILAQPGDSRRKPTSLMRVLHSHLRALIRLSFLFGRRPNSFVLMQSCNRHAIRASVNKPSDANVCRAVCHDTAVIFKFAPAPSQNLQYPFLCIKWALGLIHVLSIQIWSKISEQQS